MGLPLMVTCFMSSLPLKGLAGTARLHSAFGVSLIGSLEFSGVHRARDQVSRALKRSLLPRGLGPRGLQEPLWLHVGEGAE